MVGRGDGSLEVGMSVEVRHLGWRGIQLLPSDVIEERYLVVSGVRLAVIYCPKVVHDVAAADEEHPWSRTVEGLRPSSR